MNPKPLSIIRALKGALAVEKPSGLLSQPGRGPTLQDSVLTRIRAERGWAELVHRLDRDTSGILLVALDPETHRDLSGLFASRKVDKTYEALCEGHIRGQHGVLCLGLGKLDAQPPRYGEDPHGPMALTVWERRELSPGASRLKLSAVTGRSHQLRASLALIRHPLIGDPIYHRESSAPRLMLHATELSLSWPGTGEPVRLQSPCPF